MKRTARFFAGLLLLLMITCPKNISGFIFCCHFFFFVCSVLLLPRLLPSKSSTRHVRTEKEANKNTSDMPPLHWLGRSWLIASDDFTFSSTIMGAMYGIAAACALSSTSSDGKLPDCPFATSLAALAAQGLGCVTAVAGGIAFLVALSSSRGRIFQPSKRFLVPLGLYFMILLALASLALAGMVLHFVLMGDFGPCDSQSVMAKLKASGALAIVASAWLVIRLLTSFSTMPKHVADIEAYENQWVDRCRMLCCCYRNHTHADDAFAEAAKVLASLFRGMDIVPSDIAAGFLLVQGFQARQRKNAAKQVTYPVSAAYRETKSHQARFLPPLTEDQLKKLDSVHYYSKYFVAAYGWLLYQFEHLATGVCRLCIADCQAPCRSRSGVHYADCCFCNNTALQKITGLHDDDILLTSFDNTIYKPCFYVAIDRPSDSIIVSIRGSQSLSDAITDIVAMPIGIEVDTLEPGSCFVHNGMFKSATNVLSLLEKHGVLQPILTGEYQNKKLMVIGHSLGAGTATIMSILLWSRYPALRSRMQCLAYSPPGGLLSKNLSELTKDFVVAPFVGFDVVPRMASHTFDDLRQSMLSALAYTTKSKAEITVRCCCPGTLADSLPTTLPPNLPSECEVTYSRVQKPHLVPEAVPPVLYPPACLVHYVKVVKRHHGPCTSEDIFCPMFVGTEEVQTVLCHPMMIFDHFPDRVFAILQRTSLELRDAQIKRFYGGSLSTESEVSDSASQVSMSYRPSVTSPTNPVYGTAAPAYR